MAKGRGTKAAMSAAVIVHSLDHALCAARAAMEVGRGLDLLSGPGAGAYAGAGWWAAIATETGSAFPDLVARFILDCGDDAGAAMAALRGGIGHLAFDGPPALARRVADMAAQSGAEIVDIARPTLDLGGLSRGADIAAACREWLDANG
ncbi:MAG: hypothetical protein ACTSXZ_09850 [Alphaproteobacteria bacterium]